MLPRHHCEECILLKVPQQGIARMHCHHPLDVAGQTKHNPRMSFLQTKSWHTVFDSILYKKMLDIVSFNYIIMWYLYSNLD